MDKSPILLRIYDKSLSSRRAWIEITQKANAHKLYLSLSSRRAWIEIDLIESGLTYPLRRSPHGERGLKFDNMAT